MQDSRDSTLGLAFAPPRRRCSTLTHTDEIVDPSREHLPALFIARQERGKTTWLAVLEANVQDKVQAVRTCTLGEGAHGLQHVGAERLELGKGPFDGIRQLVFMARAMRVPRVSFCVAWTRRES